MLLFVSKNTAVALRRWLETRGLSMRGRKAELVQRVESCLSADLPIDVKLDSGKWYELAVQSLTDANPPVPSAQPPVPPVTGWAVFPSTKIPKYFNKGQIFHYIVESATFADSTVDMPVDIKTEKPLKRGKQFFESGHVQDMEDCCVCSSSAGELYYLKSIVRASFDDGQYNVLAAIDICLFVCLLNAQPTTKGHIRAVLL
ncbi:hypothetical protein V1264_008104 [Littorina saxatilis]|uniref:SAP domain-containing protein n=1 Tax=Littorina saxatilis TaxID=31220 RepID=A0AAN9ATR1_9CAEN